MLGEKGWQVENSKSQEGLGLVRLRRKGGSVVETAVA